MDIINWPEFFRHWGSIWLGLSIGYTAFFILERLIPAKPLNGRAALTDLKIGVVYLFTGPFVAAIPLAIVNELLRHLHAAGVGIKINMALHAYMWPDYAWLIAWIPLPFFLYDFFYYWFHRLQHTKWLWPQHKLHHTDEHMSVFTSYRGHWLEDALRAPLLVLPMGLVFDITPFESALLASILPFWTLFFHSNLRISMGPLTPVFAGPQWHRIHHSIETQHRDKNFSAVLPLWDIIFGTYYRPKKNEFPDTGVQGEPSSVGIKQILWGPFYEWFSPRQSH